MKILVADDEDVMRTLLETSLRSWGYEPVMACNGWEALEILEAPDRPSMALVDWMMPGPDGREICTRVRRDSDIGWSLYLILLTARCRSEDMVRGLEAGANDYVVKPFGREELRARLQVGCSVLRTIRALEAAQAEIKLLKGLLPACVSCQRRREEPEYWGRLQRYLDRVAPLEDAGCCAACRDAAVPARTR